MLLKIKLTALLAASVFAAEPNFYQGGGNEASYMPTSNVVKPTFTTPAPVYTPAASAPIPSKPVTTTHSTHPVAYGLSQVSPSLASYVPRTSHQAPGYPTGTGYPRSLATASASGTGPLRYPGQNVTVTLPAAPATTVMGVTTVTAPSTAGAGRLELGLGAMAVAGLALLL